MNFLVVDRRKTTKVTTFAPFVLSNMSLITLLPTFLSIAPSSMLEYYLSPVFLSYFVYMNEHPN
jgi:hypothetical protein